MPNLNHSKVKDWDFDDLANYVVQNLFDAMITGGTKSMVTRFYSIYNVITQWQAAHGIIKNDSQTS